jgi:nitroimidazol reductase NimA-like FMN-containing flavoprotein (pyridoxamine 5'-phosphate oxidase superfamily)
MAGKKPVSAQPLSTDVTPMRWTEACARLGTADTYWLATTRPGCRPHVVPVLAVLVDGALHFVAGASTRKAKNLARDSRCIITTSSPSLDLVVEGEAAKVRDEAKLQRVAHAYASKYDWHATVRDGAFHDTEGAPTAGPPPYDVYEVTFTTAFGFGTDGSLSSTRWDFSQARASTKVRPIRP